MVEEHRRGLDVDVLKLRRTADDRYMRMLALLALNSGCRIADEVGAEWEKVESW
jgi:hypothetical protein